MGQSKIMKVKGQLAGSHFLLLPIDFKNLTYVSRFGSKVPFLLSHLTGSLKRHFPDEQGQVANKHTVAAVRILYPQEITNNQAGFHCTPLGRYDNMSVR